MDIQASLALYRSIETCCRTIYFPRPRLLSSVFSLSLSLSLRTEAHDMAFNRHRLLNISRHYFTVWSWRRGMALEIEFVAAAVDASAVVGAPHCWFARRYWGDVKFLPFDDDPERVCRKCRKPNGLHYVREIISNLPWLAKADLAWDCFYSYDMRQ